jgi:hypothetical protein
VRSATRKRIPSKRSKPRRGPMRSKPYRDWCNRQWCAVSNTVPGVWLEWFGRYSIIDAAHTQNNGMGSKGPDSSCVPLERALHIEYDRDRQAFEEKHKVDMKKIAAEHYERFLAESAAGR